MAIGTLTVLLGPVAGDRSLKLNELISKAQFVNISCVKIIQQICDIDDDDDNNGSKSCLQFIDTSVPNLVVESLQYAMDQNRFNKATIVFIDSNYQFTDLTNDVLDIIHNHHKHVFVAGPSDCPQILQLLNHADKIKHVKSFHLPSRRIQDYSRIWQCQTK